MEPVRKKASAHVCRTCSSSLVQPLEWLRLDERWEVLLRCPECESVYRLVLAQPDVNELSQNVEAGFGSLLHDIEELDQELFLRSCEAFIEALLEDHILPMDF
jgi:uncharacterized Zn finger protein